MQHNWEIISDKVMNILKGSGYHLKMFNKEGNRVFSVEDEPTRFFATTQSHDPNLKNYTILVTLHNDDTASHIDLKIPDLKNKQDFDRTYQLKLHLQQTVGYDEGLSVNWYRFDHTIRPKDEAIHNIHESQDTSKVYGTTKSSFQRIGETRLIIRHSDRVDEEKRGSRWRKIHSVFLETKDGERFKFPCYVRGARAMARHINNEGHFHDEIGDKIKQISEDFSDLKYASRLLKEDERHNIIRQAMESINHTVKKLSGIRGYGDIVHTLNEEVSVSEEAVAELYESLLEQFTDNLDERTERALDTASRYIVKMNNTTDLNRVLELGGVLG
jgi:hypothetical protein